MPMLMTGLSILFFVAVWSSLTFILLAMSGLLPTPLLSVYSLLQHYVRRKSTFVPRNKRKFNFNEIIPGVFVGTQPRNQTDMDLLREECGVTAIICLNEERELYIPSSQWRALNFKRLHIPIPDYQGPNMDQLTQAIHFISEQLNKKPKGNVYIHCNGGKGRSAAVCVAYILATNLDINSVEEAVMMVKERRKKTSTSLLRYPFTAQSRYLRLFYEENQKNPVLDLSKLSKMVNARFDAEEDEDVVDLEEEIIDLDNYEAAAPPVVPKAVMVKEVGKALRLRQSQSIKVAV